MGAMGFTGIGGASVEAAEGVYFGSDRFEVEGIDASVIAAEVIELEARRDWPDAMDEGPDVGPDSARVSYYGGRREVESTVAFGVKSAGPEPATIGGDLDAGPKAFGFSSAAIKAGCEIGSHAEHGAKLAGQTSIREGKKQGNSDGKPSDGKAASGQVGEEEHTGAGDESRGAEGDPDFNRGSHVSWRTWRKVKASRASSISRAAAIQSALARAWSGVPPWLFTSAMIDIVFGP